MTARPFTIANAVSIETVMHAAERKNTVARWIPETESILRGTARHLVRGPDDFNFVDPRSDVRDAYLRVTLTTGFDVAWLVSDLMTDVHAGNFAIEE